MAAQVPDPVAIVGALDILRDQAELIVNIPNDQNVAAAIQGLAQTVQGLTQTINAMQNQLNTMQNQLNTLQQQNNQRFDQVNQNFDQVNQLVGQVNDHVMRLHHRQTNSEIAAINARLLAKNSGGVLQQIYDIRNGGAIPNFPATQPQLHSMNEAVIDGILPALGIVFPPGTPLSVKRESIVRKWILK
ncbi:hypothetical protein B0T18DRAFT_389067 [Schizothecium vesticola]|uniref:Uncharacterized protein n=1 Tax=Schizothecium vesticola TaxID=314040 RepID=A0AA40F1W5_9PEZI|nr:hypothetical protein B0T18DRAFT_389067 [Schizothecium vesticola]